MLTIAIFSVKMQYYFTKADYLTCEGSCHCFEKQDYLACT